LYFFRVKRFLFHSKDAIVFRPWQSSHVLFGALVDTSGWAELYGITDQSIGPNLGLYELISILEASTPNLLIVQDPFVSLLRALIASVWEVDVDSFKFLCALWIGLLVCTTLTTMLIGAMVMHLSIHSMLFHAQASAYVDSFMWQLCWWVVKLDILMFWRAYLKAWKTSKPDLL
jgi:hypothetical protein